jgi:hypothetical protein
MITDKLVYCHVQSYYENRLAQLGTGLFAALCTLPAMRPVGAHWLRFTISRIPLTRICAAYRYPDRSRPFAT